MSNQTYDVIIAGGSVAGAALGWALAKRGARVLVVEPEQSFRDRVRGESIHPWGAAEARRLGLADVVQAAGARPARFWDTYVAGGRVARRDLTETTRGAQAGLNIHHPELQEALLAAAAQAGCEVLRGVRVADVQPGAAPEVELEPESGAERSRCRAGVVVLADGRGSRLREPLGIELRAELAPVYVSGVLLNAGREAHAMELFWPPQLGTLALLVPLAAARTRLYFVQPVAAESQRYSGAASVAALLARCGELGVPGEWLASASALGPLATFQMPLQRIDPETLPRGVVAIGDAAGTVDPAFGCGLSMALRDARTLSERLAGGSSPQLAAAEFARERSGYHAALLRLEAWLYRVLFGIGSDPQPLRAAALERLPALNVDLVGLGPDAPSDPATEAALFAPI